MNVNEKLQQEHGEEMADARRFKSLVESLIYLTHTRLDATTIKGLYWSSKEGLALYCWNFKV